MDKSKAAFYLTIEELFKRERKLYMWTFTFPEVMPSWWCPRAWATLQKKLQAWYGKLNGVRVMEWHREHGAHFHVVLNKRMNVSVVRRLSRNCGFGRIHVVKADRGSAHYLAKYLGKENAFPHSGRRWCALGEHKTRVRDIEIDSEYARFVRNHIRSMKPGASRAERFCEVQRAGVLYHLEQFKETRPDAILSL